MERLTGVIKVEGRFAALLAADDVPRAVYDGPLLSTRDWVVGPTLGAIVPNWLIVVPKRPALNFLNWREQTGLSPADIIAQIANHLSLEMTRILWFEHGPKAVGTEVGCGVDYAHLHVILDPAFSYEVLLEKVMSSIQLDWRSSTPDEVYGCLSGQDSYIIIGTGDLAVAAQGVELAGSQFMRRMVADAVSQTDGWNYHHHPHHENVAKTIETFRALESAGRHGG